MDLQQKIAHYQPSDDAVEIIRHTNITLLVGISGAGKDTVKNQLLQKSEYRDIVSHTTRSPRHNNEIAEIPDVDYHFISLETAEHMIDHKDFVEAKLVHGTVYGTSFEALRQAHELQKIAITDIDVQGVDEYKELSRDVVAIFILPPSYDVWRERLQKRYETQEAFQQEWPKRRDSAIAELHKALGLPYYHFIINDDLLETVRIADEIAHKPDVFYRKDDEARLAARDLLESIVSQQ